jgi:multisubunit Na+/H+ antiporter MnhB subunit
MHIRFSPLLATGARIMIPTLVLFSLYLLVIGHDSPGGGFAGGLAASAALLLVYLAFGDRGLRRALRIEPEIVAGIGLAVAVTAGMLGLILEGTFLEAVDASADLPVIGTVKLSSVLLFDAGVYLVVVGLVGIGVLRLGGEERT